MSKKILITGSNGLLGQKLVSLLKNDHQLFATSTGQNIINDKSNYSYSSLDITDAKSVELLFHFFKPVFI